MPLGPSYHCHFDPDVNASPPSLPMTTSMTNLLTKKYRFDALYTAIKSPPRSRPRCAVGVVANDDHSPKSKCPLHPYYVVAAIPPAMRRRRRCQRRPLTKIKYRYGALYIPITLPLQSRPRCAVGVVANDDHSPKLNIV
ncbi:hypothetical protein C8R45DRAFT_1089276 [Mycena sanguinolenta]|nr:hypothetical protein C8R45DRAFT_1089276 [Mycena sanguinolenta]